MFLLLLIFQNYLASMNLLHRFRSSITNKLSIPLTSTIFMNEQILRICGTTGIGKSRCCSCH